MNYECTARSNYFRVQDEAAFRAWARTRDLHLTETVVGGELSLMMEPRDDGGWPSHWYNVETNEGGECDIPQELARHLHPEDVAVLMEAGHEGHRHVAGMALAVNAQGETRIISLADIYERARELGPRVTRAEL